MSDSRLSVVIMPLNPKLYPAKSYWKAWEELNYFTGVNILSIGISKPANSNKGFQTLVCTQATIWWSGTVQLQLFSHMCTNPISIVVYYSEFRVQWNILYPMNAFSYLSCGSLYHANYSIVMLNCGINSICPSQRPHNR